MNSHKNAPIGQIHKIHNWEFIDSATRIAYTYTSNDLDKIAKDLDTKKYFILKAIDGLGVGSWYDIADASGTNILPSQLLLDIKTVDGIGSGLDSDFLDGLDSTDFIKTIDYTHHFLFLGA